MKKRKNTCVLLLLTVSLIVLSIVPACASNYHDTVYEFYFLSTSGISDTELREKEDDTSAYMKCNSTVYPYTAHVVATYDKGGTRYDASGGHKYTFYSGTVCKLINYVYENNFSYASIRAKRSGSTSYYATGLWSPDSI